MEYNLATGTITCKSNTTVTVELGFRPAYIMMYGKSGTIHANLFYLNGAAIGQILNTEDEDAEGPWTVTVFDNPDAYGASIAISDTGFTMTFAVSYGRTWYVYDSEKSTLLSTLTYNAFGEV